MAGMIAMGQGYLILDEPLAFLDRSTGQSLVNLLGQIKQRVGVLLIEHRTDLVKAVADRVLHLSNGEVLPGFSTGKHLLWRNSLRLPAAPTTETLLAARECEAHVGRRLVTVLDIGHGKA